MEQLIAFILWLLTLIPTTTDPPPATLTTYPTTGGTTTTDYLCPADTIKTWTNNEWHCTTPPTYPTITPTP